MTTRLDGILREAIAQGLMSHHEPKDENTRPWPVMVVSGVLAWFVAIPLVFLLGILTRLEPGVGMTVLGLLMLAGAILVLRMRELPIFWEQLAVPVLIAGATMFVFGISQSGKHALIGGIAAALALAISAAIPQSWLRVFLGAAAAGLFAYAWAGSGLFGISIPAVWFALHSVVGCWLGLYLLQETVEGKARLVALSAWLEALLIGAGAMSLCALSFYSGQSFLLPAPAPFTEAVGPGSSAGTFASATSVLFAAVAVAWICYRWSALRRPSLIPVAMAAMLACWFANSMGAALLILAFCMTSGRRSPAILGGLAMLWMVGAFYYQLAWPLVDKARLLLASAAVFAVVARFGFGTPTAYSEVKSRAGVRDADWKRWVLTGSGALVLVIANAAILQKEKLAEDGTVMYVKLAPVDPRSLMQGDYMRLSFAIPRELVITDDARTLAVGRRDERGLVTIRERYRGAALARDEVLIELVRKNGRNVVATDAWFFAEGEAMRWSRAGYAEFRVTADGKALLIGLRGPQLEKL